VTTQLQLINIIIIIIIIIIIYSAVVLLLRRSAIRHLPQRPGFDPVPVPLGFMVDKVAWGRLSLEYFCFLLLV